MTPSPRPLLLASFLVAAAGSSALADPLPQGSCELTVSGAVTASGKSKGGVMEVGTDYWFTREEAEDMYRQRRSGKPAAEVEAFVAEMMKKDPRFMTLIVNCITDAATINFMPEGKYADVPFKAKTYTVVPMMAEPGQAMAMIKVGGDMYQLTEKGVFDVTAFDTRRLAGTFALKARSSKSTKGDAVVTIKGSFDYPCVAPTKLCAASRAAK